MKKRITARHAVAATALGLFALLGAGCSAAAEVTAIDQDAPVEVSRMAKLDSGEIFVSMDPYADTDPDDPYGGESYAHGDGSEDFEAIDFVDPAQTEALEDIEPVDPAQVERVEPTVLGSFDPRNGLRRIYLLVPPGLDDAQILTLANELRAEADADPANDGVEGVEHYLMDDDSQFDTLLAELPNTQDGDTSGWPAEYVTDHTVAHIKLALLPDGDGGLDRAYVLCGDLLEGCDFENPPAIWEP